MILKAGVGRLTGNSTTQVLFAFVILVFVHERGCVEKKRPRRMRVQFERRSKTLSGLAVTTLEIITHAGAVVCVRPFRLKQANSVKYFHGGRLLAQSLEEACSQNQIARVLWLQ